MVLNDRNLRKTCLSILLGAVCLAAGLLFLYMNTKAASAVKMGTVDDDWVYFRQGPGTEYSIIRKYTKEKPVRFLMRNRRHRTGISGIR